MTNAIAVESQPWLGGAGAIRRARLAEFRFAAALTAPAVILMLIFYLYPLVQVLLISITEPRPGFGNYAQLATNSSIQRVLWTTFRICLMTTVTAVLLGFAVSYTMTAGSERVRRWILILVVVPLWVSALVRAFAWVVVLRREGVANTVLQSLGVIDAPLVLVWNEIGVVIGMVHYMMPYAILPMFANMRDIDQRAVMAARGLGATRWQAFRRIFLPLSVPGIIASAALVLVYSLGFFVIPAILGGGKTLMIAEYVRLQIVELVNWGLGTMLATFLVATVILLLGLAIWTIGARRLFGGGHS